MNGDDVLRRLEVALTKLASPQTQQRAAMEIRDFTAQQIDAQYATGRDMYGNPWPTPKTGGRAMVRTSALRSGYRLRLERVGTGYRIAISNTQPYAGYLQSGTPTMKARTHVPRGIIPPMWRVGYQKIIQQWFEREMRG